MPILLTPSSQHYQQDPSRGLELPQLADRLGVRGIGPALDAQTLPFANGDVTAGSEHEMQVVVIGTRQNVDLPLTIEDSNFFKNIRQRIETGEAPKRALADLKEFLAHNRDDVWDNSWVRFPVDQLAPLAQKTLNDDLRADKTRNDSPSRSDAHNFLFSKDGKTWLRTPVSYLLKLALADAVDHGEGQHLVIRSTGKRLMGNLLSDNTSPETISFYVAQNNGPIGRDLARESSKRFLLCQLLIAYANRQFRLQELGQQARVCFAPNPPFRQKQLNDCISDSFYRELFMSPCLSGWDRGEEKHQYMGFCHQTLSRSQLNAVISLREAGIITNNLVVLPNTSNVSLANNGVHISLGSRKLSDLLANPGSGYDGYQEKYLGDLVIKIVEHFLPLFVGMCSASPYRLDFTDFHPEKVLGFLPHELHATHLRMFWRRWRKKAKLKILGHPVTPFGPPWLDNSLSRLFGLKGDLIPDHRLIDYLVSIPSTSESPALDGKIGNMDRLKTDLSSMGIFDPKMATYLLFRMREYSRMGFSGFEGRLYSLFPSFDDLALAADLQALLIAFAYQLILSGEVAHVDIPDDPFTESERRQAIFAAAINLPTFFVHCNSENRLMASILRHTGRTRPSHRYGNFIRVRTKDYCLALLDFLRTRGAALVEVNGMAGILDTVAARLKDPSLSASQRITDGIMAKAGIRSPFAVRAQEFNLAAEEFYRDTLRQQHLGEALGMLAEDFLAADRDQNGESLHLREARALTGGQSFTDFLVRHRNDLANDSADVETLRLAIALILITIHRDTRIYQS